MCLFDRLEKKCISGYQAQATRLQAMDKLKKYNCRIFITTDLVSYFDFHG